MPFRNNGAHRNRPPVQLYYREGASINLYAKPIEGVPAILDLDDRHVIRVINKGVVPLPRSATTSTRPRSMRASACVPRSPESSTSG